MATQQDVRRIALALPGTSEGKERFGFGVLNKDKVKGFAWVWRERVIPKQPRVPNDGVLAVRVANLAEKDLIIASDSRKFFTEPHYNGFPAILVRLAEVTVRDLDVLLTAAWQCLAPRELVEHAEKKGAPKKGAPKKGPAKKGAAKERPSRKTAVRKTAVRKTARRKPRRRS